MAKQDSNQDAKPRKLPDGMVRRRKAYYADFGSRGRRVRKKLSGDFRVASEMLAELKLEAYRGNRGIVSNDYPLDKLLDEWLRSVSQTISPSSADRYRELLRGLKRLISVRMVKALDTEHVEVFRAERLDEGVSAATVNFEVMALTSALTWGVARKRIGSNPIERLKPLKHHAKEARALTEDEVERLLDASSSPAWRDIWYAYLVTGLRKMELARLVWSDIDWTARELIVRATGSKTSKTRRIPIDAGLFRILTRLYDERNKRRPGGTANRRHFERTVKLFSRDHVFVSAFNTPLTARLYDEFITTCQRAGIETRTEDADGNVVEFVGVHSTRHTFATHLIQNRQSPRTVQDLLGHATLEMTMKVYGHVFPENKRAAIDNLPYGEGPAETPDVIRLQS